jgi:putative glutathione S-transferase
MGLLVDGVWHDEWYDTKSTDGKFVRQESSFREFIGSKRFPAEPNRYHLYISHACPWAHRTAIFRSLKGLENLIGCTTVQAKMGEFGWALSDSQYLHEIYTTADPNFTGRVTVPILWDTQHKTIVNNESSEIIRIFNTAFNGLTQNTLDFYPEPLRDQIDEINDFIYESINNGVYKAGFATTQEAYEEAVTHLFTGLDKVDNILSTQRYLAGHVLTEADWRLFTTLLRFDPVYVGHFKCNIRRIMDYPHLSHYVRELYQIDGVAKTVHMDHIKKHYYASHPTINPTGIIPLGPEIDYTLEHNRNQFR